MTQEDLPSRYRGYFDCLNRRYWSRLGNFVSDKGFGTTAR